MEGLSTEMAQQKNKLKDRLKQLKAKKFAGSAQSKHDSHDAGREEEEEIHAEEENLQRLESNYEKIVNMLTEATSDDLQKVGLARLKDLLDQSSTGEGTPLTLQVRRAMWTY